MVEGDKLSQDEIDKLLKNMTAPEGESEGSEKPFEEKKVREYNFRRPVKFSREQQRTLQLVHENFARELSTYLSGRCRTFVDINYASIDQITFSEFQQSLTSPTYIAVFSTSSLAGNAILQVGLDIGYAMIDRLLGGPGSTLEEIRTPTDVETAILRKESSVMLRALSKAWSTIEPFEVSLEKIETNPQFIQIAPPNEMTILVTLSITIRDVQGFMNICFPSSTLEPISDKLSTRMWTQTAKKSPEVQEKLKNMLLLSKLDLTAVLGKTDICISDMLKLQIGDVVRLDSFYQDPIDFDVQGVTVFKSKVGTNKGFYAVQIEKENKQLLEKTFLTKVLNEKFKTDKPREGDSDKGGM